MGMALFVFWRRTWQIYLGILVFFHKLNGFLTWYLVWAYPVNKSSFVLMILIVSFAITSFGLRFCHCLLTLGLFTKIKSCVCSYLIDKDKEPLFPFKFLILLYLVTLLHWVIYACYSCTITQ